MVLIVFYRGRQIVKSELNIIVLEFEATVTYDSFFRSMYGLTYVIFVRALAE